ncbi:MAG: glucose-6-phosphate isomerase [Bacteroidetes bacterium]|nr:glucose-6-phosphate isomerase [Bacteroidota bacterium]
MLISKTKEWSNLQAHCKQMQNVKMKELFNNDKERFAKFSLQFNNILFDYSKNIIDDSTIKLLLELAHSTNLKSKIKQMFTGKKINTTENRAVLHTALRNRNSKPVVVDGEDIMPEINNVLDKMETFVEKIHDGEYLGATGKKITTIVNIGIGGSDLGPMMVCQALEYYKVKDINSYFVSNVDGADIANVLKKINPETSLFIIASKTFTTQETMANALAAKKFMVSKLGDSADIIAKHFVALSTNINECKKFGIDEKNIFTFWDWVGGRYSLWSSIGLSIALSIGMNNFEELLTGGYDMDKHFKNADFKNNIPVLMALLGIWYNNFFNAKTLAVIPYCHYLRRFPTFLQQMDMESNGKYITKGNEKVDYNTGPVIWGEAGTNAQHSFFQLIHQGTQMIPVDFISFIANLDGDAKQHNMLLSNFFAQTEALMKGKTEYEVRDELLKENKTEDEINHILPHKVFEGNKPSNTILIDKLTPYTLGMLIAMYEHKVFVQGAIWNVNQFDQWGVELGKQLAKNILSELNSDTTITTHDCSTNALINYCKEKR